MLLDEQVISSLVLPRRVRGSIQGLVPVPGSDEKQPSNERLPRPASPMRSSLLADVRHHAEGAGLNLIGLVDAARFDRSQPKEHRTTQLAPRCGTALVLASGGRSFWQQYAQRASGRGTIDPGQYAREVVTGIERRLAATVACRSIAAVCPGPLNFAHLGEAAGFGTISPVSGLLLHPQFGPWISLRSVLLLDGHPFGPIADAAISDRFQPCCGCSQPCMKACPADVHDGAGTQDLGRCASHRHLGNCSTGCTIRSACPVGAEHRDAAHEHAHRHAYDLSAMQRGFGLGFWKFVPSFLRRRS